MTLDEIKRKITEKTGVVPLTDITPAGLAVGVPSSEHGIYHWSLIPIADDTRERFVEFMVSLVGTTPNSLL